MFPSQPLLLKVIKICTEHVTINFYKQNDYPWKIAYVRTYGEYVNIQKSQVLPKKISTYIDDLFIIRKNHVQDFHTALNDIYPNIRFILTKENGNINYLNISIRSEMKIICTLL